MAQRPAYARDILEMRRFGDRRPQSNMVIVTDRRPVVDACRKLGCSAVLVEPFLPYNFDFCYDLEAWVLMTGEDRLVRAALHRARPRSVQFDRAACAFWLWIEWLAASRSGRTALGCVAWFDQTRVAAPCDGDS